MPEFIRTNRGWINLGFVESISSRRINGQQVFVFFGKNGDSLGEVEGRFDPFEDLGVIVPAEPDTMALVLTTYSPESDRQPTAGDFTVDEQMIIAWRINGNSVTPVFSDFLSSNQDAAVPTGPGKWSFPGYATFSSASEIVADALTQAEEAWDRQHPTP